MSTLLLRERPRPGLLRLTLNRPDALNSLSPALLDALIEAFASASRDPDLRVVTLRGAGARAFSAGYDVSELTDEGGIDADGLAENDRRITLAARAIEACPRPVIAAIRGHCIGAGLEIALACDLRIAAADARFRLPPARIGWVYTMEGLGRLVAAIGPAAAKRLTLTAESWDADRAANAGLIDPPIAVSAFDAAVEALEDEVAKGAPIALAGVKQAIETLSKPDRPNARWASHLDWRDLACGSDDFAEARRAIAEKRPPVFRGR